MPARMGRALAPTPTHHAPLPSHHRAPQVTPSSKTVGDLAQFMVSNKLTAADVTARADSLSFPSSVVEYLLGALGVPPGGFPEPLRCRVLGSREHHGATNGRVTGGAYAGRPGAELPPLDFGAVRDKLRDAYGDTPHGSSHRQGALPGATQTRDPDVDVMSYVMFPQVRGARAFARTRGSHPLGIATRPGAVRTIPRKNRATALPSPRHPLALSPSPPRRCLRSGCAGPRRTETSPCCPRHASRSPCAWGRRWPSTYSRARCALFLLSIKSLDSKHIWARSGAVPTPVCDHDRVKALLYPLASLPFTPSARVPTADAVHPPQVAGRGGCQRLQGGAYKRLPAAVSYARLVAATSASISLSPASFASRIPFLFLSPSALQVTWELNGEARVVKVQDKRAASKATAGGALGASGKAAHVKADPADPKQVAAPMPGVVVDLRATAGKAVKAGEVVAVLSAMKMESAVTAPRAGVVKSVSVAVGDTLEGGDLVAVVE